MLNKKRYIEFCNQEEDMPVFLKPWWLNSVCGDNWDVLLYEENQKVMASMVYSITKKLCFKLVISPHLTPIDAFWISYPPNLKRQRAYSYEHRAMEYFANEIDRLKIDYLNIKLDNRIENCLGLYWGGFTQKTNYKYIINNINDLEQVYTNISKKVKRIIRIAEEELVVSNDISEEEFCRINELTFKRQGKMPPYSRDFLSKLIKDAKANDSGEVFVAKDKENNPCAVLFVAYDKKKCYSIALGMSYDETSFGGASLLLWEAIKFASQKGLDSFDFCGSMIKSIEAFIRYFGGELTPYFQIEKNYSTIYSLQRYLRKKR